MTVRRDVGMRAVDVGLFAAAWSVVVVSSLVSVGIVSALAFFIIGAIIVARSAVAGLVLCLLLIYAPSATLGIPNVFAVIAGMVALRVALDLFRGSAKINIDKMFLWAVVFCGWVTISTMRSPSIELALEYYIRYVEGVIFILLAYLSIRTPGDLSLFLKSWVVLAGLATLITVAHVMAGNGTPLYVLMQRVFSANLIGVDDRLNIVIGGVTARRFLLPGQEPNYTSAGLLFPFGLALAYITASRGRLRLLWIVMASLIVVGVIGTYSRSGFIAATVIAGLFLIRSSPKRGVLPAVVLVVVMISIVFAVPQLERRMFGIQDAVMGGAAGRLTLWIWSLDMWSDAPLIGQGLAAFYAKYRTASHSSYLQVLAETGLVGLGLFLAIIVASFKSGLRTYQRARVAGGDLDAGFQWMLLAALAGFSVMIATITYQDIKLFWLACGVVTLSRLHLSGSSGSSAKRGHLPWVPLDQASRLRLR